MRTTIENVGEFISYKNKAIKCMFKDRTIVRVRMGEEMAVILSKGGERLVVPIENAREYEEYMKVAMEFMDYAFTPSHERERREQEKVAKQLQVEGELSKIQRTIGIIQNRVPVGIMRNEDMTMKYNPNEVLIPDIQEMLQKTSSQINSIKELLSNL